MYPSIISNISKQYLVKSKIGAGGMASVYKCEDVRHKKLVAIKLLHQDALANSPNILRNLKHEVKILQTLNHPNIIQVLDSGEVAGTGYIVMELAAQSLSDVLVQKAPLRLDSALHFALEISDALTRAHHLKIIHRDIKPANVLVMADGTPRLADFGLARPITDASLKKNNALAGTLHYLSPEALRGESLDARTDIWAFGIMLYEMLTGLRPFRGKNIAEIFTAIINDPVYPEPDILRPDLPDALVNLMNRMLQKDRDYRIASMRLVGAKLEDILNGSFTLTAPAISFAAEDNSNPESHELDGKPSSSSTLSSQHFRQVTILAIDLTDIYDAFLGPDDEDNYERQNELHKQLVALVAQFGGLIHDFTSTKLTAIWGLQHSSERNSDLAVRTALMMQSTVNYYFDIVEEKNCPLSVAIHSGAIILDENAEGQTKISGSVLNVVNKIERQASAGTIAISEQTAHQLRNEFTLSPLEALHLHNNETTLRLFRVHDLKHAFQKITQSIFGAKVPMVGRTSELELLQDAFYRVTQDEEVVTALVIGEAGIGKSRLLHEFTQWLDTTRETFTILRGRALAGDNNRPYALLRSLLLEHFEIRENDPISTAHQKIMKQVSLLMSTGLAPASKIVNIIEQIIGLNAEGYPTAKRFKQLNSTVDPLLLQSKKGVIQSALNQWFDALLSQHPVIIELEDIHWADNYSLEYLNILTNVQMDRPLLIIGLTRPDLLARDNNWLDANYHRIDLKPLRKQATHELIDKLLFDVNDMPHPLVDLMLERSQGNPLYIEELIKMLMEDGVLLEAATGWQVDMEKFNPLRIPPTLTALLQGRFDNLSPDELRVAQQAAVIGRIFWDQALYAINTDETLSIRPVLGQLTQREIVYPRYRSEFVNSHEYLFKHTLLRDTLYNTLLKRQRQEIHQRIADWLVAASGERSAEFATEIAHHYEATANPIQALPHLKQGLVNALENDATQDAYKYAQRAQKLIDESHPDFADFYLAETNSAALRLEITAPDRLNRYRKVLQLGKRDRRPDLMISALEGIGRLQCYAGDHSAGMRYLIEAITLARQTHDANLGWLLISAAYHALVVPDYEMQIEAWLNEAEIIAQEQDNLLLLAHMHSRRALYLIRQEYYEAAMIDLAQAIAYSDSDEGWNIRALAQNNLAEIYRLQLGDYEQARSLYLSALALFKKYSPLFWRASVMPLNLGLIALHFNQLDEATEWFEASLAAVVKFGYRTFMRAIIGGFAVICGRTGDKQDKIMALQWLSAINHDYGATYEDEQETAEFIEEFRQHVSTEEFTHAWATGKLLPVDDIAEQLLASIAAKQA